MKKILLVALLLLIKQINAQLCFNPCSNFPVGNGPYEILYADFNNDGYLDIASLNNTGHNVSVVLGSGNGNFGTPTNYNASVPTLAMGSADFNNDGLPDLVSAGGNPTILLANGTGGFNLPIYCLGIQAPWEIVCADFDSDGNVDMAFSSSNSDSIQIAYGLGTGHFATIRRFKSDTAAGGLVTGDFNADGLVDLACANLSKNTVSVLLGAGAGSFASPINFQVGVYPFVLTAGDFNGDGKTDLATANNTSNDISVLLNVGGGNFSPATNYVVGNSPYSIILNDFNNDARADLAVANSGTNDVSVLTGQGNGSFLPATSFSVNVFPASIVSADFNGDQKADIVTGNYSSNDISILLNCTPVPACVASVTDSLFYISPLNWGVLPHYSPQIINAKWDWGDGTFSYGLYPGHTYATAGRYSICVTAYASCGDSVTTCRNDTLYKMANNVSMINVNVVSTTTSAHQIQDQNDFMVIYPNPSAGLFTVEFNISEKQTVQIFDLKGILILEQNITGTANIDTKNIGEGVYMLVSKTGARVFRKMLIIAR